jgi:hypothetical protein
MIKSILKKILPRRLKEYIKTRLVYEKIVLMNPEFVPPRHFYSAIPDLEDVRADEARIWSQDLCGTGIDLQESRQLQMLQAFEVLAPQFDFPARQGVKYRYYHQNDQYGYGDSIFTYCMINHIKPKRIIEAGSGYSSALLMDINEHRFNNSLGLHFIEPYPDRLYGLLKNNDSNTVKIIVDKLQNMELGYFDMLEENDVLFIDSTHVCKIGSDVNFLIHNLLPRLRKGVYVHIHDIFYPFEYPKNWVYQGRVWSEAYILRAFLQYNHDFEIVFWNSFIQAKHREAFHKISDIGGASIWLRRKNEPPKETGL